MVESTPADALTVVVVTLSLAELFAEAVRAFALLVDPCGAGAAPATPELLVVCVTPIVALGEDFNVNAPIAATIINDNNPVTDQEKIALDLCMGSPYLMKVYGP